jgi:nitroimidazol reductase NimA-like FMN-containing flavoprotein (pyridoxamine 5'-phosphate oxidase superfamily)
MGREATVSYVHRRANRQYVRMTDEEMWKFLESRDRVFVGFPAPGGFPHVSPIWFCVLDGKIYLRTQEYKVKTKLATGQKVCLSIDDGKYYRELRGVVIWGSSKVLTDPNLIQRVSNVFIIRYKNEQWKSSEMPRWWVRERKKERRAYIEVVPERVSSWDNSKLSRLAGKPEQIRAARRNASQPS